MATTDLSSKSLGDILLQSGIGNPNHTAAKGSLYSDKNTNTLYVNTDGSTKWQSFSVSSYGEGYYVGNSSTIAISAANTWTQVTNTFTTGETQNFTVSGSSIVLNSGCDGLYEVCGSVTLVWVAGAVNMEAGVSLNSANPVDGAYNGATLGSVYTTSNVAFSRQMNLVGNDALRLAVNNRTDANDVIVRHAQLVVYRVK